MNFFEQQDQARRRTGHLVLLFVLAVVFLIGLTQVLVVAAMAWSAGAPLSDGRVIAGYFSIEILGKVAIGIICVVALGSLYKWQALRSGGKTIAESMGGRLILPNTDDPQERKIQNVVEEMAIASGIPVPPVYLIDEDSINAFAAGYGPADAVIGVTRGCIQLLDRDELQGVIGHEFSHILNGDMRLNIRLIGILHGILIIGIIGYHLLRSVSRGGAGRRASNNNGALPFVVLGGGLMLIGYVGTFFGHLIKAAVSRQREYLADASAVQFTRNPAGIAGALKKIGGYAPGSQIENAAAAEISHLFFGQAVTPFFNTLMATHPPLERRIKRIEPGWAGHYPKVELGQSGSGRVEQSSLSEQTTGFVAGQAIPSAAAEQPWIEGVGLQSRAHLDHAAALLQSLPAQLLDAAREPYGARALVYCLLLARNSEQAAAQWQQLERHADTGVYLLARQLDGEFTRNPEYRLILLDLCLPSLGQLTPPQYLLFKENVIRLMQADNRVELYEWAIYRILLHYLEPSTRTRRSGRSIGSFNAVKRHCSVVLSALTDAGTESEQARNAAFAAAISYLKIPGIEYIPDTGSAPKELAQAVSVLGRIKPLLKPRLLKAMCACVAQDGIVRPAESEMVRAVADSMDCPMPPLLSGQQP